MARYSAGPFFMTNWQEVKMTKPKTERGVSKTKTRATSLKAPAKKNTRKGVSFEFLGDYPAENEVKLFGLNFSKGQSTNVEDLDIAKKLMGNSYFRQHDFFELQTESKS